MTISEYAVIDRITNTEGRVVIPPHLALEFNSDDEADAALIERAGDRRQIMWQEADIIASRVLYALTLCDSGADRRRVTADRLRHYAYLFGDIHPETARKRLNCGVIYPPQTAAGEVVRAIDKPITLYENALVALRYDDDPVRWVLYALEHDIPAHKIRQYIEAEHSEGPAYITTYPTLFSQSIPSDDLRMPQLDGGLRTALASIADNPSLARVSDRNAYKAAAIAAHVADAVYLALAGGTLAQHGDLTAFSIRVSAECEKAAVPAPTIIEVA